MSTSDQPDRVTLELKDAFSRRASVESDINVRVQMLNINAGHNLELLNACKPLAEYAWVVENIRSNTKHLDIEQAVDEMFRQMPKDYMIRDRLIAHRAEVKNMCLTEYNEEETMELFKRDFREEGRIAGLDIHLIEQVCKKLMKGKQIPEIAEDLEEPESTIAEICRAAEPFDPEHYDAEAIRLKWREPAMV